MSKPIAVFFHGLFYFGDPPELRLPAVSIIHHQMEQLRDSGLEDAASEIIIGINGGEESESIARALLPLKAKVVYHGLESRAENLTIVELEKWIPAHPDHYVLYFHAKGSTHDGVSEYSKFSARWRWCLMHNAVVNWRRCVADLDRGFEAVGSHWMVGLGHDHSQNIFAGNFWWAKTSYLATLPSIYARARIKDSGIAAAESRYEAEVWIGNGPRLPSVMDYHPAGIDH